MKVFLAAVLFIGLCVLGLGVSIFFRKGGHFPETDISKNKDMKRLGITCPREDELRAQGERFRNKSGMTRMNDDKALAEWVIGSKAIFSGLRSYNPGAKSR